jgi:Uri superfamily endonuclease
MSVRKGTYVLFVTLGSDRNITVGARGPHLFKAGTYCYVGSAMAGLDQRLTRHLAHDKTLKWHIDYLTTVCDSSEAWISYPEPIPECELADRVGVLGGIPEMEHFGCSDCRCLTHLFRVDAGTKAELVSELHLARYRSP